jgi:hypothetical protein
LSGNENVDAGDGGNDGRSIGEGGANREGGGAGEDGGATKATSETTGMETASSGTSRADESDSIGMSLILAATRSPTEAFATVMEALTRTLAASTVSSMSAVPTPLMLARFVRNESREASPNASRVDCNVKMVVTT